jgi:hypothetical protein
MLSANQSPAAIEFLEQNQQYIYWYNLCKNPAAIHLLEANLNNNNINWCSLCENPAAIHLITAELEANPKSNKINWYTLSANPAIFKTNEYILK